MDTELPPVDPPAAHRRRRNEDFDDFANTQIAESEAVSPDLDVTSSGFGGHASPPEHLADLWRETSSATRWRQTLWLAVGFGAVVGSLFTAACFLLLPGALRAFGH